MIENIVNYLSNIIYTMKMKKKFILITAIISLNLFIVSCSNTITNDDVKTESANEFVKRTKWFREAKFGVIIHWGPISILGKEISWCRDGERPGISPSDTFFGKPDVPVDVYDNLYKKFNPVDFDANEWVNIFQEVGMNYMVFVTKHADGFVNFDSKYTDYKITSKDCPYGKDITKMISDACIENNMKYGFYYSPADWYNPDCHHTNHSRYLKYMYDQIDELCTNYGKLDLLWFDTGFPKEDWDSETLVARIRLKQKDVMINNRLDLRGDFTTPEGNIGTMDNSFPQEVSYGFGTSWSWKVNDKIMPWDQVVRLMIKAAGNGANFLLGIGPMPNGKIEQRQIDTLKKVGKWIKENAESYYGTYGGPFIGGNWGVSTFKDSTIYIFVENWTDQYSIKLPGINSKILKANTLDGDTVNFTQTESKISLNFDSKKRRFPYTIIKLSMNMNISLFKPIKVE